MRDFDAFQAALEEDSSYMTDLVRSMALVLEEFGQGPAAVYSMGIVRAARGLDKMLFRHV